MSPTTVSPTVIPHVAAPSPATPADAGSGTGSARSRAADAALVASDRRVGSLPLAFDNELISAAVGRPVRVTRLRYKPGAGVVVAFVDAASPSIAASLANGVESTGAGEPAEHGWLAGYADDAKVTKTIDGAAAADATARRVDGWAATVTGGVDADRTLARTYSRLRREHPAVCASAQVVRHNPHRRLVLRAFDGERELAVKLTPRLRADDPSWSVRPETVRSLGERGVPILPVRRLPHVRGSSTSDWWGTGDLLSQPGTEAAALAGRALATLHSLSPFGGSGTVGASTYRDSPARAARGIAAILPEFADRAARLARDLDRLLAESRSREGVSIVHGDFSPDQVLVDRHPLHAASVRLIDFDRSDCDAAGRDLGSFAAASRVAGREDLSRALREGYLAAGGTLSASQDAWCAFGLLLRTIDPFRNRWTNWVEGTEHILTLTEEAMSR